ncbi:MAG: hypothetical protein D6712_11415, partial [Chloroflexi bacterium]
TDPISIPIPASAAADDWLSVTVLGVNGFDPVLALIYDDGYITCLETDTYAAEYSVNLPSTGEVPPSPSAVQAAFSPELDGITHIAIGGASGGGEFVLLVENLALSTMPHTWSLPISDNARQSGQPLTAYLLAELDSETVPQLVTADSALTAEPLAQYDIALSRGFVIDQPAGANDLILSVPLGDAPTVDLQLSATTEGLGVFIVHYPYAAPENTAAIATLERIDGRARLLCDGREAFADGALISLPPTESAEPYTVTVIGVGDFEPVLALLPAEGEGICSFAGGVAVGYAAELPVIGEIGPSPNSAQVVISPEALEQGVQIVVGNRQPEVGEFLLIIEGGVIVTEDEYILSVGDVLIGDILEVHLTPAVLNYGLPLSSYMIGADDLLDPVLIQITADGNIADDENGVPIACNDAGTEDSCWQVGDALDESYVVLADGVPLNGSFVDAMLNIPLDAAAPEDVVRLLFSAADEESLGSYIIILLIGVA